MLRYFEPTAGTTVTASGNSTNGVYLESDNANRAARFRDGANIAVLLDLSSVTGTTPSYTVEVQWSNDNITYYSASTPDTFTAITATGNALKTFTVKAPYARLKYTVTGTTPSAVIKATAYVTP